MVKADVADFICPGCQARYKIVRAKSAARSRDLQLHCIARFANNRSPRPMAKIS
jgi:hypothetical protein